MKKIKSLIAVLMIPLFLLACATFTKNSYIAMDATGVTYNTVMTGVAGAQLAGKITTDQRAKINQSALIFKAGFIVGADALLNYKNNLPTSTQGVVTNAIAWMLSNWLDLANLINSIIPGSVPTSAMSSITLKGKTVSGQKFMVSIKKLDSGEISVIIQIGSAIVAYLIPAIQSLITDIGKITISDEDIIALKSLIKNPDQY